MRNKGSGHVYLSVSTVITNLHDVENNVNANNITSNLLVAWKLFFLMLYRVNKSPC